MTCKICAGDPCGCTPGSDTFPTPTETPLPPRLRVTRRSGCMIEAQEYLYAFDIRENTACSSGGEVYVPESALAEAVRRAAQEHGDRLAEQLDAQETAITSDINERLEAARMEARAEAFREAAEYVSDCGGSNSFVYPSWFLDKAEAAKESGA